MSERWKLYLVPWLGFAIALAMHVWHIGQPPELVGDEVFFVNDGQAYVLGQSYFDPHPPLGKMQLGMLFTYAGSSPVTWRVMSAVEGALLVPLVWWLVWTMTRKQRAADVVVILLLLDGFLLVDARLGLINIPYILYGLAGLAAIMKALTARRPWWWVTAAGVLFGLAVSDKWLAGTLIVPALLLWCWPRFFGWIHIPRRPLWTWPLSLGILLVLPAILYWLVFAVHFAWLGVPNDFWGLHSQMLDYQLRVPASGDPYGSPWWGWLMMWQPALYWVKAIGGKLQEIWSLPNPWLWWTGSAVVIFNLVRGWRDGPRRFMNILLLSTWLPFALIHRIMYSYHAIPFSLSALMLLSIYLEAWTQRRPKIMWAYVGIALGVFLWFAPWYFGFGLSSQQHHLRRWLPGWYVRPETVTPASATLPPVRTTTSG